MTEPPPGIGPVDDYEFDRLPEKMDRVWLGRLIKMLGRWRMVVTSLARLFCNDVGQEPGSPLIQLAGFPIREERFRKEMEKQRNTPQLKDLILEVSGKLVISKSKSMTLRYFAFLFFQILE